MLHSKTSTATPNKLTEPASRELIDRLREVVGTRFVITDPRAVLPFATGYRIGRGSCLAVVRPASLLEMWHVLECCVASGVVVVIQAANTGLTGGSTPTSGYECDAVLINTLRISRIQTLSSGKQVVCLAGATLYRLEQELRPLGREPHSVIGSSCIGASIVGGICNNSGGALVRRGPAYTEQTLYARLSSSGQLELVNHLGMNLGETPREILSALDDPAINLDDRLVPDARYASDHDYEHHVRDTEAETPARFNADPRRLYEASGSAGKIAVFAVRLDTFPREDNTATFCIGVRDPAHLEDLRRSLLLSSPSLPISAEYIHREAFDLADRYGRDSFLAIRLLGTERLPVLNRVKTAIDGLARRISFLPQNLSERILQGVSRLIPCLLPRRLIQLRNKFEHLLLLKVSQDVFTHTRETLLNRWLPGDGDFFECTSEEAEKAFLHRFVTAGAAMRYRAVHGNEIEDIIALDIALPRNTTDWFERLPAPLDRQVVAKLYYGHFLCHVLHQDYLIARGEDPLAFEHEMWRLLDARGAEYPAEHNVGHVYPAKPDLARHYQRLDPLNKFNPGIGQLSKKASWQ